MQSYERHNLPADVITKLLGNVAFKGVSAGWLISTSTFGKDGRGLALEWQKKPTEERRKLQLYTPEKLAKLLISCGRICAPEVLKRSKALTYSDQVYLLITNFGRFWAAPLTDVNAGVHHSVMLFDASTGEPITEETIIASVSDRFFTKGAKMAGKFGRRATFSFVRFEQRNSKYS